MIGFLLKKTFYDLWDNMFKIVLLNLGFLACCAIPVFLPLLTGKFIESAVIDFIIYILGILLCSVYLAAASFTIRIISDYGSFTFGDFLRSFKTAWPAGIVMGCFVFLVFVIVRFVLEFYFIIMGNLLGFALGMLIIWTTIYAFLSFQYYFTVYSRLGGKIIKTFRKCMLISLDNTGFSIFLIFHNFFAMIISLVLAFMFPGPVGILLYIDQALRLRLLKYDYLEENPEANRRKIPWDALLIEEREKTGTRSLKNFIFPWKD